MPQFRCVDIGADCSGQFAASTQQDLLRQVSDHLSKSHNIKIPSQTILSYIAKRSTGGPATRSGRSG
jgi:predicted small metal-binding protein